MPNVFETNSGSGPDEEEYEELSNVISLDDITFGPHTYGDEELDILQPRLVAVGYTEIVWSMGERDAFGPLSRVCTCRDAAGEVRKFVYG